MVIYLADVLWTLATNRPGVSVEGHAGRIWAYREEWTRFIVYVDGPRPSLVP